MTADEERRAILREISELVGYGEPPAGAVTFTTHDFAARNDVALATASRRLKALYDEGVLGRCQAVVNHRPCHLYWKLES